MLHAGVSSSASANWSARCKVQSLKYFFCTALIRYIADSTQSGGPVIVMRRVARPSSMSEILIVARDICLKVIKIPVHFLLKHKFYKFAATQALRYVSHSTHKFKLNNYNARSDCDKNIQNIPYHLAFEVDMVWTISKMPKLTDSMPQQVTIHCFKNCIPCVNGSTKMIRYSYICSVAQQKIASCWTSCPTRVGILRNALYTTFSDSIMDNDFQQTMSTNVRLRSGQRNSQNLLHFTNIDELRNHCQ